MILVWSLWADRTSAAVLRALRALDADAVFLDQARLLDGASARFRYRVQRSGVEPVLTFTGGRLRLCEVTAAFLRPYATTTTLALRGSETSPQAARDADLLDVSLWSWADQAPGLMVNRPRAGASNSSKPAQLEAIARAGFQVPRTLVTNDPAAAEAFWRKHGAVIYKSISGVRSIVARFCGADLRRLTELRTCPVQFQELVPGTDVRVHTVGTTFVHATEVLSEAVDYRYPGPCAPVRLRDVQLPDVVADGCLALAADLGLALAGIDLRRTPGGEWYGFEANPTPAFDVFDLDGDVAARVALLLVGATT